MVPILADENLSGPVVRALLQKEPALDLVRVQDVGLMEADDQRILKWAAEHNRVLLTHDRETVPHFAYERIRRGQKMTGVIVADDQAAPGRIVSSIAPLVDQKDPEQFRNRVFFVSG